MSTTRQLSLTAWLSLLVIGTVVPLLIFAAYTLHGLVRTSRTMSDRGQVDTTRALALAMDGEVRSWRAALTTLSTSSSLQRGRWAEFYDEARQVATRYNGWIVVNPADGPQILNTLRPFGTPLPQSAASAMVEAVFKEGKPVTDMTFGAVAQRYIISNSIPVFRNGKVVLCLSLNFGTERLTQLLQTQQFAPTWVAAINDSQQRVVARSVESSARVGNPVIAWFGAASRAADHGIVTGQLIDGRQGQIAFQRLQEAPWVVAFAVPVAELQTEAPSGLFILVGVTLSVLAVGMALYMGRKVTMPVRSLARSSGHLLHGEVGAAGPPSAIREVEELQQALADASNAARAHAAERERAAEALRLANQSLETKVLERTEALASANAALQVEVAQRKAAEEESRSMARFPAENPNPVLRLDRDGRVLSANPASTACLGQWGVTVAGVASAPWPIIVRDALTTGTATTVEMECGGRTYAIAVAPILESGYVNLYGNDITERIRAEEDLARQREWLRITLTSIGDAVIATDTIGRVTFLNPVAEALTGWKHVEAFGRLSHEVFNIIDEQTREAAPDIVLRVLKEGRAFTLANHTTLLARDGREVPIEDSAAPIRDAAGKVSGVVLVFHDVTEKRRALDALQRSQLLAAHSRDIILFVRRDDGRVLEANAAAVAAYGYAHDELLMLSIHDLRAPGTHALTAEQLAQADARGILFETTHRRKSGEDFTVEVSSRGVTIAGVRTLVSVVRDITERKRAEKEREAASAFLQLILESHDRTALIRDAVAFFQQQSGCEAVGLRLKGSDDYPYCETRGFSGEFVQAENRLCARDCSGRPFSDAAGSPIVDCLCGHVIRGRFDPSKAFFTSTGSFWTNSTTELLADPMQLDGLGPLRNRCNSEGYESMALIALWVGGDRLGLLQMNDRRTGRFSVEAITLWERLAGHLAVALAKYRAEEELRDNEHRLRRLNVELDRRVTERTAELDEAVRTLERQADRLRALAGELTLAEQRERRRLADVLHDELQQLLVATRLRAHMLGRAGDSGIQQGVQELVALTEEALAATRSLTGELHPPTLQRGGLVPALEWLVRWMEEKHKFTVRLAGPAAPLPPLPEDLSGLLYQAVRELLLNAVKYAEVTTADVTVAADERMLTIVVADTGIGFDPWHLRAMGGTEGGYGLFGICERLEWIGGRLDITSAPGEGSRFTLVAPLGPAIALMPTPQRGRAPSAPVAVATAGRRVRILLADDHALVRRGLATMLGGEADLEIVGEAADGQEAVDLARDLRPDVILMDVSMPVLNGIEATRMIHAELPTVRVVGLSMFEETEQPEAMHQAGAVAYLSKGDAADSLLAVIRSLAPSAGC